MGKVIENVGVLDLTSADLESVNDIEKIFNVGVLIYSPSNAPVVSKLNIQNLGASMEVPAGCKLLQGQIEIDQNYLNGIEESLSFLILGQAIIKQDVQKEDIEKKISELYLAGQLLCPEKLLGIVQSKCSKINGEILPYANDYSIRIGKFSMNNQFLKTIDKPVSLVLVGKTSMIDKLDEKLFDEKIENIHTVGRVIIKEEYLEIFNKKSKDLNKCRMQVIPAGYTYVKEDIHLDAVSIKRFDHACLYTDGMICFTEDVTPELLKNRIEKIYAADAIVCRRELKEAVYGICDNPSARICDYSGRVFLVDGERRLTQTELKYIPGPVTYIVHGTLTVNSDISPEVFMEKVEYIDNFGEIICDNETCGLINTKLRVSEGDMLDHTNGGDSNIGYLKL